MNKKFDGDPIIEALRASHPKQGPDPEPGEPLDQWAERYMAYVGLRKTKSKKRRVL